MLFFLYFNEYKFNNCLRLFYINRKSIAKLFINNFIIGLNELEFINLSNITYLEILLKIISKKKLTNLFFIPNKLY